VDFHADREQASAAFAAAAIDDIASAFGGHAGAEAVLALACAFGGLIGAFAHDGWRGKGIPDARAICGAGNIAGFGKLSTFSGMGKNTRTGVPAMLQP